MPGAASQLKARLASPCRTLRGGGGQKGCREGCANVDWKPEAVEAMLGGPGVTSA